MIRELFKHEAEVYFAHLIAHGQFDAELLDRKLVVGKVEDFTRLMRWAYPEWRIGYERLRNLMLLAREGML